MTFCLAKNYQPRHQLSDTPSSAIHCRTVASLIAGNLPTRVYYVSLGGFDTHVGERGRHDTLMTQLSDGIAAFWADLKAQETTTAC